MTPQPAAPLRMSEIHAGDTHVCGDTSSMYRLVCEPLAAVVAKQNPTLSDEQLCAMRLGAPLSRWPATARANVEHVDEMHPGLIDQTADAAYHKVHEYLSREFPSLADAARQALSIASADLARHLTLALCAGPFGLVDRCKPHRLVDATCVLEGYASELPLPIVEAAFKTFGYLGLGGDFTPAQLVIGDCMSASKYINVRRMSSPTFSLKVS